MTSVAEVMAAPPVFSWVTLRSMPVSASLYTTVNFASAISEPAPVSAYPTTAAPTVPMAAAPRYEGRKFDRCHCTPIQMPISATSSFRTRAKFEAFWNVVSVPSRSASICVDITPPYSDPSKVGAPRCRRPCVVFSTVAVVT